MLPSTFTNMNANTSHRQCWAHHAWRFSLQWGKNQIHSFPPKAQVTPSLPSSVFRINRHVCVSFPSRKKNQYWACPRNVFVCVCECVSSPQWAKSMREDNEKHRINTLRSLKKDAQMLAMVRWFAELTSKCWLQQPHIPISHWKKKTDQAVL